MLSARSTRSTSETPAEQIMNNYCNGEIVFFSGFFSFQGQKFLWFLESGQLAYFKGEEDNGEYCVTTECITGIAASGTTIDSEDSAFCETAVIF